MGRIYSQVTYRKKLGMAVVDLKISQSHPTHLLNDSSYDRQVFAASVLVPDRNRSSFKTTSMAERINSALVTEQDLNSYLRSNKNPSNSQVTYTRFKPVTSYPATSLIATLYKQQALGESRYLQQTQDRLPNLFQKSKFVQQTFPYKRRRGIRAFAYPYNGTANTKTSTRQDPKPQSDEHIGPDSITSQAHSRGGSASTAVGASATWTAVHDSISANGRSMFPITADQKRSSTSGSTKSAPYSHNGLQRTTINYVPFYEIRGRGDGASVVDVPSIDVEGKKIDGISSNNKDHFSVVETSAQDPEKANEILKKDPESKAIKTQHEVSHLNRTPTDTNEETADSLVSALIRRSQKDVSSSTATPTKVEKKVRFSSSVTTNQIDQPSYTETLLESLRKRIENTNTESRSVSSTGSKGNREKSSDATSVTNRPGTEEDFVTPVMKVIVTKRHGPIRTEVKEPNTAANTLEENQTTVQRRVANMASRVINNYVSISPPNDVLRRGTQATRRASTAGQARSSEALARVSKLVPKRQTVVMPNFPKQPAWSKRSLTVQSSASSRLRGSVTATNTAFTAAVRGSSFEKSPRPETSSKQQSLENLQSRLNSTTPGVYISTSQNAKRPSTTNTATERVKNDTSAKSLVENASALTSSTIADVQAVSAFQPIPSMPDHINFCDPRKTELIMKWLDDVNKKRNIDSKIKRNLSVRRLKAAP